jgi:16S rRNA U516 pseudouridylate synthase RsuA-like enzyme
MRNLAKREQADLASLEAFDTLFKTQKQSISRRILGSKVPANKPVTAYLTQGEVEALKQLADNIGLNVSTLIRLTMAEMASAYINNQPDPRAY